MMSKNSNQRKEYSIEKLNDLREGVRESFFVNRAEALQLPNNKNSPYYTDLRDDILLKTKNNVSEGTLLKFFYDNTNRKYQIITILTIEDYISKSLSNSKKEKIEEEIKIFANKIYVELTTRKAGIPIDENIDVIEEIYNSWYKLFCLIREEIKVIPIKYYKEKTNCNSAISVGLEILNNILRPHLTEHQAKFRSWLAEAKKNSKYKNLTPQELQRKYPVYNALIYSLKNTNQLLIESAGRLIN